MTPIVRHPKSTGLARALLLVFATALALFALAALVATR